MFEKIRNLKNKKGFTLVELIVVLVILAILAALLVPALTGYIDKANKQKIIAETRQAVMATQTLVSETYGKSTGTAGTKPTAGTYTADFKIGTIDVKLSEIKSLGELPGNVTSITIDENGKVTELIYTATNSKTCTYKSAGDGSDGKYDIAS